MNPKDRIIVALDVNTLQHAGTITHALKGFVNFYKVGWRLFMSEGMGAVRWLSDAGHNVFLDLKMDDIPSTIEAGVSNIPEIHNLKFMTFQGDQETLKGMQRANNVPRGAEQKRKNEIKFLFVPALSSRTLPLSLGGSFEDYYLKQLVDDVMKAGCNGLIASGDRIKLFHERHPDAIIVSPGIRPEKTDAQNHQKYCTPKQAIEMGADYLVIGRPIVEAKDPKQATLDIIEEISEA